MGEGRKSTSKKKHLCIICQRTFKGLYYLKRHSLTHTGEKPYKCNICSRAFPYRHSLSRHKRCCTFEKWIHKSKTYEF